ncbi:MAG: dihydrolipoyl dehydrogenase, partial [Deltaproteobacteria bacterium]|nr:dihydrolipoyl dehydrogenase [Deltaproteobacteria bacterium]
MPIDSVILSRLRERGYLEGSAGPVPEARLREVLAELQVDPQEATAFLRSLHGDRVARSWVLWSSAPPSHIPPASSVYDLVVIGGGPGGYHAALHAAELGLKVLLIEKGEHLGGTCLHAGCIPSKAYLSDAVLAHEAGKPVDFAAIHERKNGVVAKLSAGINALMKAAKVDVVHGEASLLPVSDDGTNRVTVAGQTFSGKNVILATGTSPSRPPFPFNDTTILTTDEFFKIKELPKKLMIVGGGVIGIEMACAFNALGSEVTVVEFLPEILSTEDPKVASELRKALEKRGIKFVTGQGVENLEALDGGARATLKDGSEWTGDMVLVSTGRRVSKEMGAALKSLGIETTERGFAQVDQNLQTTRPGVYAIGDLTGRTLLAHVAMEEGEFVTEVLAGRNPRPIDYEKVVRIAYPFPEIASIGLKESQIKERGLSYIVGRALFAANGRALAAGHPEGFVQIYAVKEGPEAGKILGALIFGEGIEDLIQIVNLAMRSNLTIHDLARANPGHPTKAEAVWEAAKHLAAKIAEPAKVRPTVVFSPDAVPAEHELYQGHAGGRSDHGFISFEEAVLETLQSFYGFFKADGRTVEAKELESQLFRIGIGEVHMRSFLLWLVEKPELAARVTGSSDYWHANENSPELLHHRFVEQMLHLVDTESWFAAYAVGNPDDLLGEVATAAMEIGAVTSASGESMSRILTQLLWSRLQHNTVFHEFLDSYGAAGRVMGHMLLSYAGEMALRMGVIKALSGGVQTPYWNTPIPRAEYSDEDLAMDQRSLEINRYNALVTVLGANERNKGLGGHLGTGQSQAAIWTVLFNRWLRPQTDDFVGDVYLNKGHDSPLDYARAYLHGYLELLNIQNFRMEDNGDGLPSYAHGPSDTKFPWDWAT